MTNEADPLDPLYDAATTYLLNLVNRDDGNGQYSSIVEYQVEQSKWVIRQWLARRDADRQYELQKVEPELRCNKAAKPCVRRIADTNQCTIHSWNGDTSVARFADAPVQDKAPARRPVWCDSLSPSMGECVLPVHDDAVKHEWSKTEVRDKLNAD